jgi:hypothetical protein
MRYFIWPILITISTTLHAQKIEVGMKNGTYREKKGKEQIERIVNQYQDRIEKWIFTNKIVIDENVIPFSHPVLTLNCNYLDNDLKQLANFLHEEFHWFEEERDTQKEKAINEFKIIFPEVPVKGKTGARNNYSTYLHLIVCDLEFQAMTEVAGAEKARQLLKEWTHYTWIYDKVLNDGRIREINTKNGFVIP